MLSAATKASAGLTRDLAENDIRDAASDIEDDARSTVQKVGNYAARATDKVRGAFSRTVDGTNQFGHRVESEIKSNPVRSSALALGAGFVLGALLAARR